MNNTWQLLWGNSLIKRGIWFYGFWEATQKSLIFEAKNNWRKWRCPQNWVRVWNRYISLQYMIHITQPCVSPTKWGPQPHNPSHTSKMVRVDGKLSWRNGRLKQEAMSKKNRNVYCCIMYQHWLYIPIY